MPCRGFSERSTDRFRTLRTARGELNRRAGTGRGTARPRRGESRGSGRGQRRGDPRGPWRPDFPSFGCIVRLRDAAKDFRRKTVCPVHLVFEEGTVVFKNKKPLEAVLCPLSHFLHSPLFSRPLFLGFLFFFHVMPICREDPPADRPAGPRPS